MPSDALMNCDNCMCKPPCEAGWLVLPSYNRSLSGDEIPKFPALQFSHPSQS